MPIRMIAFSTPKEYANLNTCLTLETLGGKKKKNKKGVKTSNK